MALPRRLALLTAFASLAASLAGQSTFIWTGDAATKDSAGYASADASTPANWIDHVAPTSSSQNTLLLFGSSSGISGTESISVRLTQMFEVRGITFMGSMPQYYLYSDDGGTLSLGQSGVTLTSSGRDSAMLGSNLQLLTNQTWSIDGGSLYVYGRISQAAVGTSLTKTGAGSLILNSSESDFSGGLVIQSGTLFVGASSALGDSDLITGPVGSGTLTLGDGTSLRTNTYSDITLHNAITLGNYVTLGNRAERNSITLAGAITPTNTNTTLQIGTEGATFIHGAIGNAPGGATSLTITNSFGGNGDQVATPVTGSDSSDFPVVVLTGANTYSGATHVQNAGVIFYTPASIGQTSAITASSGYVGTGFSGGMEAILARIANPSSTFDGALGFDTNPDLASTPTPFTDNVNLAAFANDNGSPTNGFWGLGSMTSAILRGTITPPDGGNYVFGGGSGKLYVESNLDAPTNSSGAGVRVRSYWGDNPITVWLRGTNSFTGNLMSDHSIVVLDSATALPAGSSFSLDAGAYVGYTENFTAGGAATVTPAEFIARLSEGAYNHDSILGFDSANKSGREIDSPINLGSFEDIFIGTTTHVHLTGTITAPSASKLSVTGIDGGWLNLDSPLLASNVNSLNVGATASDTHRRGYVEITSPNSDFAGGTTLNSGYLLLGASSALNKDGQIVQGPLGTGALNVAGNYSWDSPTTIAASTPNVTLHNDINFSYGTLQLGVPVTSNSENTAFHAQSHTSNNLTLNGNLSGSASMLVFSGNGTITLNGDNTGLFAYWIQVGNSPFEGTPLVVANTDHAFGTGSNSIYLGGGADLQFTSTTPSVGALSGGDTRGYDTNNRSFIALAPGSTLTINQHYDSTLYANIGGTPGNFSGSETAAVNASLVKNGYGTLTLAGDNTYSGTTTVKSGLLLAGSANAFGSSAIVLDGGGVGATSGIALSNAITFGNAGGTLGGNGTISSAITAGTNVTIAPGNSPGQLTFTSALTFASGGFASFDIANFAGNAGSGWDQIVVSGGGTFAITATIENPFTVQVNSWSAINDSLGALTTDYSAPASLAIVQTTAPITGFVGDGQFGTSNLVLDTSNFTAYQGGTFSLSLGANSTALMLNFTPVPEPSTYVLLALGLGFVGLAIRRQRR